MRCFNSIFNYFWGIRVTHRSNILISFFIIIIFSLFNVTTTYASSQKTFKNLQVEQLNLIIKNEIEDKYNYAGLASFYGKIGLYVNTNTSWEKINDDDVIIPSINQTVAIIGRYKVLFLKGFNTEISFENNKFTHSSSEKLNEAVVLSAELLDKSLLRDTQNAANDVRYIHLWWPFRRLAIAIEESLLNINSIHEFGWGFSVIIFALLYKLLTLPIALYQNKAQKWVVQIQEEMAEELLVIKQNYSGEQAHDMFWAAHKKRNITPYYTLKPLIATLLPIPFLIAIFNCLGELVEVSGHSFLGISDLAYPDKFYSFVITQPQVTVTINILPILMTTVGLFSIYSDAKNENSFKNIVMNNFKLIFINLFLFIVFYPFPAVLILFWICVNIWHILLSRYVIK